MKKRISFKRFVAIQEALSRTSKVMKVHFENPYIQNGDERFLQELVGYIKQNISNSNFSVEALSCEMNMGRVLLYKKVKFLTGKSPVEFIRAVRLQKAVQLLENTQMRVSLIASEVGFDTPHYFSKLFKKEYNIQPSVYMNFARKAKAEALLNTHHQRISGKRLPLLKSKQIN
ncbi:MAG TPA: AraC family transcriptional regulator [Mucilaginibacter sp.]|jgi:AraC-like DNA-binding protein|nr:AraC family transcriptional regulator [Mucilaginibacter sp.]